ncbi:MAG: type III-A CRISPR-associated RAMP protein Csm3 [Thermoprotei archaeon]|nr:MAG: type III-A CRISPR-associated RAMP protein Csm3 [Thermoprotei archaeon]
MTQKFSRKLLGILDIAYILENETGLIIRFPLARAKIGGADVMPMALRRKYCINGKEEELEVPYIPGSSIKGRMRGLLELKENVELYTDGKITQHFLPLRYREIVVDYVKKYLGAEKPESFIDHVFGYSALHYNDLREALREKYKNISNEQLEKETTELFSKLAITRLIVYDVYPSNRYVEEKYNEKQQLGLTLMLDDFLEEKPENRIDRITSAADPRLILRIKPGVEFEGLMRLLIFDRDYPVIEDMLRLVFAGIKLIEDTYLGGSGTRGYGKVRFKEVNLILKKASYYQTGDEKNKVNIGAYKSIEEILKNIANIANKIKEELKTELTAKEMAV